MSAAPPPGGFPRGRVLARIIAETETELGSLPMVLATPLVAAVFATVVAVSEPSPRVVRGVVQSPGILDALRYAVEGALGGIVLVVVCVSICKCVAYACRGDALWRASATLSEPPSNLLFLELSAIPPRPGNPSSLGALECILEVPGGIWCTTRRHGQLLDRSNPDGKVWRVPAPIQAGAYRARWYATPDGTRTIEVGRCNLELREAKVEIMADEVWFSRRDGSTAKITYEGDLLVADSETERVVVLEADGTIVLLSSSPPVRLDDEMQLGQLLSGRAYQEALGKLYELRARRLAATEGTDDGTA